LSLDWHGIAERIRGLIRYGPTTDVQIVAERLGVDERALRLTMDGRAPLPTAAVISALVRVYGLDPTWVLTGEYDPATHRTALESDRAGLDDLVSRMIVERVTGPISDAARHPSFPAES